MPGRKKLAALKLKVLILHLKLPNWGRVGGWRIETLSKDLKSLIKCFTLFQYIMDPLAASRVVAAREQICSLGGRKIGLGPVAGTPWQPISPFPGTFIIITWPNFPFCLQCRLRLVLWGPSRSFLYSCQIGTWVGMFFFPTYLAL